MSLPNYLSNIKSSGIYRFVWDKSEIPGAQADTLRLVVGYSDRGPFNTPVYVKDAAEFKTIYGNVSKKLERYGSWFHRMAIQALKKGPILALNLKPFISEGENAEKVEGVSFNPQTELGENIKLAVEELYNTDRFWTLEPEVFENIEDTEEKYISIFATDSLETSNTIFVRGYHPKGYDVTFKTWYSSVLNGENLPPYLDGYENEVLADYFAEIYVFRGEFTPAIATNDKLGKYFNVKDNVITLKPYLLNAFGEKIDTLEALATNDASNFIKSYHGILLPDFLSSSNTVISLDAQFNQDNYLHKMMMRMNQAALYEGTINLSELNTTGFNIAEGKSMMSFNKLEGTSYKIAYDDNTDALVKWVNAVDGDGIDINYYDYTYNLQEEDCYQPEAGLKIGDRFVGESGIVTLDEIVKSNNTKDGKTGLTLKFSGPIKIGYEYSITYPEGFDKETQQSVPAHTEKETFFRKLGNSLTTGSANLVPTYIKGYTYNSGKPASTKQIDKLKWQNRILDVLGYKGIRTALTSRVDVDYRYIVDTFESFVEANCKGKITSIAKEKDNAFALVNFPAMSSFSKCEYISFRDNNGVFDTKYIPMGGNPQKVMSSVFSLASEEDGASYASYNTCLNIKDVNTNIKFTCPSAALVSNLYMDKYTKYFPYTIVAGPNRAVVRENGLIGPDFNFSREDLDNLEPFGVNCMVMVPGKGTYINSNQTAKQNPVTTLSKINVRELCIFLQDEIEKLLQQYQWDFNTPNLRNTIKDRADVILETAKNNGGVYRYINVCDESNNTEDVINNEMFVLSTSIEPGIGAGKMVQELTLYRKGGMSSLIKD